MTTRKPSAAAAPTNAAPTNSAASTAITSAQQRDTLLIAGAVAGDPRALKELVERLTPIIRARAARMAAASASQSGLDLRQAVADLTQEVFVRLFREQGAALRAWDSGAGLSFDNFVGLLARREVSSVLRRARRSPFSREDLSTDPCSDAAVHDAGVERAAAARQALHQLWARLKEELSPLGLELFRRLYVVRQPVGEICRDTGRSPASVYQWRSRLSRLLVELR